MEWMIFLFFSIYAAIGVATLLLWWLIYQYVLARGYSVREAVFGYRPNPAVALDLLGGFLATGLLVYAVISLAPMTSFRLDVAAVGLSILGTLVLLAVLRLVLAGVLRLWFRQRRDAQGDIIRFNNELFRQRNLATSLFSLVVYLVLVAGLIEVHLWHLDGYGLNRVWNMLATWLLGALLVGLHSFLYLGYGPRNHILHECFHDNNPAAPTSLLGLAAGMLMLNHQLILFIEPTEHLFSTWEPWRFLAGTLVFVLIARGVLQFILLAFLGISLRRELVIRDNAAWGLVDGGLILALSLIPVGLLS